MRENALWVAGFLCLYAAHAIAWLAEKDVLAIAAPAGLVRMAAAGTLVCLALLVAAYVATRDEVARRFGLEAGALAGLTAGFMSYGLSAFSIDAPIVAGNLWALAMTVFLGVHGARLWQAR